MPKARETCFVLLSRSRGARKVSGGHLENFDYDFCMLLNNFEIGSCMRCVQEHRQLKDQHAKELEEARKHLQDLQGNKQAKQIGLQMKLEKTSRKF